MIAADILHRLAALTAKDENGLLPCQCGGNAKTKQSYNSARLLNMRCKKCGLLVTARRDEAIEKWNNRPREATLVALVKEAAGEIERLRTALSQATDFAEHVLQARTVEINPSLGRWIGKWKQALNPQDVAP